MVGSVISDTILNTGSNVSINGGKGDDYILLSTGTVGGGEVVTVNPAARNVTFLASAGNDTIFGNDLGDHVYQVSVSAASNDFVYNFGANDVVEFLGAFTSADNPFSTSENPYTEETLTLPNFKNLLFTCDTATLTLMKLPVGRVVNYRFNYTADGETFTVNKSVTVG